VEKRRYEKRDEERKGENKHEGEKVTNQQEVG